eukprot:COSAG06_NODE_357_length_16856_cov_7.212687_7_plen_87_part_00
MAGRLLGWQPCAALMRKRARARARDATSRARGRAVNTDFMQYIYHRGHLKMAGQVFDDNIILQKVDDGCIFFSTATGPPPRDGWPT